MRSTIVSSDVVPRYLYTSGLLRTFGQMECLSSGKETSMEQHVSASVARCQRFTVVLELLGMRHIKPPPNLGEYSQKQKKTSAGTRFYGPWSAYKPTLQKYELRSSRRAT